MNKLLLKFYIKQREKQELIRTKHICRDCKKVDLVARRMSVLYLFFYVIAGVLASTFFQWWAGFVVTIFCLYVNAKLSKPQCKHCLSHNVEVPTQAELAELSGAEENHAHSH